MSRRSPFATAGKFLWSGVALIAVVTTPIIGVGCGKVSGTGRTQLNAFSIGDEIALGDQAYDEMLQGVTIIDSGPDHDMVVEVTDRIAAAAARLHPEIADRFTWEVVLVDDDEVVNAWALPGGKMAVYTGILSYTRTPDGLAAVMGHEAAHAIARHGGENLTRQGLVNLVLLGASAAAEDENGVYVAAAATAYGLLGETAFSRSQESEADELGLFIAADAGYDPREAISLWERMGARGGEPPEFISTHPNSRTRIERLQALMPAAMEIRRRRLEGGGS
jgi:predicted Zn-dependent protease